MKVSELMTAPAVCIDEHASFKQAAELMIHAAVSALPVVDADGRLVGIVSEADLVRRQAFGPDEVPGLLTMLRRPEQREELARSGNTVADVMSPEPAVADAGEDVRAAARRMAEHRYRHLPVLEHGKVVGVVSRADLVRLFHRTDADLLAEATHLLESWRSAPERHDVTVTVEAGVVTLHGSVEFPMDRGPLVGVMWRIPGVVDVRDHMDARQPDPLSIPRLS